MRVLNVLVICFFTMFSIMFFVACGGDQSFNLAPASQTFKQNDLQFSKTLDILWVIDNSGSMQTSQDNLRNNFDAFLFQFVTRAMDFHMAVVTTDAYKGQFTGDQSMSLFRDGSPTGGYSGVPMVTSETPNFRSTMAVNLNQGIGGDGDERAFQSFLAALKNPLNNGFLRPNSFLAVIILSDEDDFSSNLSTAITDPNSPQLHPITKYRDELDSLVGVGDLRRYSVSAITIKDESCRQLLAQGSSGQKIGYRHMQLATMTEGVSASLCGDFAASLNEISGKILELITGFKLERIPRPETIVVYVNGAEVPQSAVDGWTYEAALNMIKFHGTGVPKQGATIGVNYQPISTL
jgi:hypothetical protein